MYGLLIGQLSLSPLIENVPADGKFLTPDLFLAELKPAETRVAGQPRELALVEGKTSLGKPLAIRGCRFERGFAVPVHSELTYELADDYRRFVAVIGLADGWQGAGPYSILLDGEPFWTDAQDDSYGRNSPGQQLDLEIPPGHKTITLRAKGNDSEAAWAQAGFVRGK
jgi:hypothetical protein